MLIMAVRPSRSYLSVCVSLNVCVNHSVASTSLHSCISLLLYMRDISMWKTLSRLPFHPLGWVTNQMNSIPTCNLSNRSHTSQDTCLISGKQLSCSHEFVRASSRTDPTKDLRTDLECTHVLFPVQADSLKQAGRVVWRGGWGPGQWHTWCAWKMYSRPINLLRTFIVLSIFSLPFSNFTSHSLTCLKGVFTVRNYSILMLYMCDHCHHLWFHYDYD